MKKWVIVCSIVLLFGIVIFYANVSKPPKPTITAGKTNIQTAAGPYCWQGLTTAECVSTISSQQLIEHHQLQPVHVSPGESITIEFSKKPEANSLYASLANDETEVVLNGSEIQAPQQAGEYIYDVSASWERGNASYSFIIEVR